VTIDLELMGGNIGSIFVFFK